MAHGDLKLRERDERYQIDMVSWHDATTSVCKVCLAGCVISRKYNEPACACPSNFAPDWVYAFLSLDCIARGGMSSALTYFESVGEPSIMSPEFLKEYDEQLSGEYTTYAKSPVQFHSWLYKLTELLKKHGI